MFGELNGYKTTVRKTLDLSTMEFKSLKDFCGRTLVVDGFFFSTGRYGKQVAIIANGYKINMPKRAVEPFEKIYNDDSLINAMLDGHLMLKDIKMVNTANGTTTSYTFADC